MASVDAQGLAIHKIDAAKKHRHDFVLGPRDPYLGGVLNGLIRAVLPDIKKAFRIDACHTDRFIIARYDDSGGYFRRHRDNSAPNVAFRQFALSVTFYTGRAYPLSRVQFPSLQARRWGRGGIFLSAAARGRTGDERPPLCRLGVPPRRGGASRWLASTAKRA